MYVYVCLCMYVYIYNKDGLLSEIDNNGVSAKLNSCKNIKKCRPACSCENVSLIK